MLVTLVLPAGLNASRVLLVPVWWFVFVMLLWKLGEQYSLGLVWSQTQTADLEALPQRQRCPGSSQEPGEGFGSRDGGTQAWPRLC